MTEEAANSNHPLGHKGFSLLSSLRDADDAPAELRMLAERLLSVLKGERDRDKLTAGLSRELGEAVEALLTRISATNTA